MSTNPSYLQSSADGEARNYRDWGLPLGRRFRALKLWFLIREQGVHGLQGALTGIMKTGAEKIRVVTPDVGGVLSKRKSAVALLTV